MPEDESPVPPGLPADVAAIRRMIRSFFAQPDPEGRRIGSAAHGVYSFYDYDSEPIYVGQTRESLSGRVGRHLTNQRTDAVAMNVLDPFEVAYIEVWPLDDLVAGKPAAEKSRILDQAEYTVFQQVLAHSQLGAVLNEKPVHVTDLIELPRSFRGCIIPEEIFAERKHPDVRIARRASTIANLARVISERDVSDGLRITLLTQAKRLERLATTRLGELGLPRRNQRE